MNGGAKQITGGCLCQSVRYRADQPPTAAGYCHCRMCQKALGNLFGTWVAFDLEGFSQTGKEPRWHRSSDIAQRCFCEECGSPIAYLPEGSDTIYVWMGTVDEVHAFEPEAHYHVESRIPWVNQHDHLPVGDTTYEV